MLPTRNGVGPSQVALPAGPWASMLDFLVEHFPAIPGPEWQARMAGGDVIDGAGQRVMPHQPYLPYGKLFYYRSVPHETPNPAQARILFEDELLVVADKPHFLPVTPSGNYLQETLLVRLRRQLG
ncbi:MAG: pseudouridine synthase, partial [Ramlibacter sp.]